MSSESDLKNRAENFKTQVWKTQQSRFTADRRCRRMYWCSLATVSLLSVYVLFLSVSLLVYQDAGFFSNRITVATIASSMGILVLGIFESSKNYLLRAERFLMCARELGDIVRDLDMLIDLEGREVDSLNSYMDRYSYILDKYNENHSNIDYNFFRAESRHENSVDGLKKLYYIIRWYWSIYWKYATLLFLPIAITYFDFG